MKKISITSIVALILFFSFVFSSFAIDLLNTSEIIALDMISSQGELVEEASQQSIIGIEEGNYYIQNVATDRYIKCPSYVVGASLCQNNYDCSHAMRWSVTCGTDGYYTIQSLYNNLYMGIDPSDTTLVKQYVTESNYTKWIPIETNAGNYILVCKATESTNDVLAVPSMGEDVALTQVSYVIDNDYKDEWCFIEIEQAYSIGGDFFEGGDVTTSADRWDSYGYNSYYLLDPVISELTYDVLNSEVVYFSSHGAQHLLQLPNGLFLTDGASTTPYDSSNTVRISDFTLTDARLYIYDACNTASTADGAFNLCVATINAGVDCVIGWTQSTTASSSEKWQTRFHSQINMGATVEGAVRYANSFDDYANNSIREAEIFGNGGIIPYSNMAYTVSSYSSRESDPWYRSNLSISFPEYNEDRFCTIVEELFDITLTGDYRYSHYDNGTMSTIGYTYYHNGYRTYCGISATVKNGKILSIRVNNWDVIQELQKNSSTYPVVTQAQIDAAEELAYTELKAINQEYIPMSYEGEYFYDIENGKYYYRVHTEYKISENMDAYGMITTDYVLSH